METEGYEVLAPQRLTMYLKSPNNSEACEHVRAVHTHTHNNVLKNSQHATNTKQSRIN